MINEKLDTLRELCMDWADVVALLGITDTINALTSEDVDSYDKTYLAEAAGAQYNHPDVAETLIKLLNNPSALVREGAVYGLGHHMGYDEVVEQLDHTAQEDTAPGVRQAASELFKEYP